MNILFFSRLFYPHIGGVEKHVLEISKSLIKRGHDVVIVTEDLKGKIPRREKMNSIQIYRIPVRISNWLKKFRIWIEIWKLRKLIEDADVIHCHDVFFWYLPFRFLFPSKKVFTTFHGYENYPLKQKDILIHKISEKLSNGNICIGHYIKKWYGTKPTYTAYGGVRILNFPSSIGRQFQISNKIKKESAVFVGRLDEQTGIKTYASAIELIRKRIPDFRFEIIGDGRLRKKTEDKFRVLGFKENAEKYFQKYNFAFVSRYLSILEAMAAKSLVFAVYDNPLKEDYLRLAPFSRYIIIANSASELVSKISFYLDNIKSKEKMIENAYVWARKHSWEEMVNMYLKLWRIQK